MFSTKTYLIALLMCLVVGCDNTGPLEDKIDDPGKVIPPIAATPPIDAVRLEWAGIFAGSGWISINSFGWLSDHRYETFLPLSTQLDSSRHQEVLSWFNSMSNLPATAYGGCADGTKWTFTRTSFVNQSSLARSFECEERIDGQWDQLISARDSLLNLAEWFHSTYDPWVGIEYKIEFDQNEFTQSDTLEAR